MILIPTPPPAGQTSFVCRHQSLKQGHKTKRMLSQQKYTKEKLQNAAAQYGLNVQQSLKMTLKSL